MSKRSSLFFLPLLAGALLMAAQGVSAQVVRIDGSSTVYPITEAVADEFQKVKKNVIKISVGISGTGGGFKKFCRGETDISDASRPILKSEMELCRQGGIHYLELPVAFDALTVVVNPRNTFLKEISVEQLKAIWEPAAQGRISRWNQINPAWPDAPIKLYGPGAESGTFDYFTEAVVGKAKASRSDYTASEDDNVLVQGIAREINALGYFGYAYYAENAGKLKALPIVDKAGRSAVLPSEKSVLDGTYQPLSRPIFIYVNAKSLDKPEVREFVEFYMKRGPALAKEVRYVPLPAKAYAINGEHLTRRKLGTVFGGVAEVGVTIEDLQKREARY